MKKIKGNSQFTLKQTPKTEKGGRGGGRKIGERRAGESLGGGRNVISSLKASIFSNCSMINSSKLQSNATV